MKNPYIQAIERRLRATRALNDYVSDEEAVLISLLRQFKKIDKQFSIPVVSKLLKVAEQCEAGGHKSRARMFRALAREFEVKYQ